MKNKSILISILLGISIFVGYSQTQIKGVVLGEKQKPIEYAGVIIQNNDSSVISNGFSDVNGNFNLKISDKANNKSPLKLRINYLGYEPYSQYINNKNTFIEVNLIPSTTNLEEVQILAKRINTTPMGYSINLTNDIRLKSENVAKTLILLPGITKQDGVYKINGVPVSQFYVNGQKVTAEDLETIPADMLSKADISFIDNIGASKSGNIISFTLKNAGEGGYYGNIKAKIESRGKYFDGYTLSNIINGKYNNLNVLTNISYSNYPSNVIQTDNYDSNGNTEFIHVYQHNKSGNHSLKPKLSLLYEISKKQSLGFNISTSMYKKNKDISFSNNFNDAANNFNDFQTGSVQENTHQGVLSYTYLTNDKGGMLKLQTEFLRRTKKDESIYQKQEKTEIETSLMNSQSQFWNSFIQYVYPVSDKIQTSFYGVLDKLSDHYNTSSTNSQKFWNNNISETYVSIFNPYTMMDISGNWDKINFLARISYQGSFLTYRMPESDLNIKRNINGFEPSIRLSCNFGKNQQHTLTSQYKRSVQTFPYSLFNPNKIWSDRYHYTIGNPEIMPLVSSGIQVMGSFWNNKLGITIGYGEIKNRYVFSTFKDKDMPEVTYTMPINGKTEKGWDFGLESNLTIVKNWEIKINGNWSVTRQIAFMNNNEIKVSKLQQSYNITNIFTLGKGWDFYLDAYYEPSFKSYDRKFWSIYGITGDISKSFKNNTSIYLSYAWSKQRKLTTYLSDGTQTYHNLTPVPYISLTYQWKFKGGKQVKVKQTNTTKSYDEIKDVK